jgi:sec-independent protein translocase protein TatA
VKEMFGNIGFPELLVILVIVLLLFGAKRLPEISRGIGKSVHEFKKGLREIEADVTDTKKS